MNHIPVDPGEQECFIYYLKPGAGEEYDRLHAHHLPQIRARLCRRGVHDYSIFRRGDLVISVLRRPLDPATQNPEADEEQCEWSQLLRPLFVCIADMDGERLTAHRVFRLD